MFFSPIGKQIFAGVAFATFILLVVYGMGIKNESAVCESRVKIIYLKAHPLITKKNIAKNWRVSPTWDPSKPARYKSLPKRKCGELEWGCR